MPVLERIEIFNVVAPTSAFSGDQIIFDVGLKNRYETPQQCYAWITFKLDAFDLDFATGLEELVAFQSKYFPIWFNFPGQTISVTVHSVRYDPATQLTLIEDTRGPYNVTVAEVPPIVVPSPPSGPYTSPPWLVNFLATLVGQGDAQIIVDWGVGTLNNLFNPLIALRNTFIDTAEMIKNDALLLHAFLAQKDMWLAQQSKLWSDRAIADADALDKAQSVSLWDGFVSAINPVKLVTDVIAPSVDAIADFVGAPWEWLKAHTPLGVIEEVVAATWTTLIALPDNWTNFFWFPMDVFLNWLDLWLYEEVE